MRLGLDVFLQKEFASFKGKRIGLVTNMTGVNEKLIPSIDLFYKHPDIQLTALYAPEHGIRGDAKEGEKVESTIDPYTSLPVYSLYGASRKPSREMLEQVDVVVFDLQDIGSRYYTFIYTMAYVMEACAENHKHFVVLDRPNPISGDKMEGNLVEEDVRSFVGLLPIPNRHAMTVAELALLFKHEFGYHCELTVVPMEGWNRSNYFDDTGLFWVPPSPNTTNIDMNILYPGTCLVEGTNLSEGRGTTRPFELVGAPFIDGQDLAKSFNQKNITGVLARPTSFIPTYQKHKDKICGGIQLHVVNRDELNSLEAGIILLETIAELYPEDFSFLKNEHEKYFFDLLAGTKALRNHIWKGTSHTFLENCTEQLESFRKKKEPYLLYK
ncbi:exo-beta-N-acetylmuramidase NamZ domain-containing protein [Ornithinibacillus salinisoli]|uniref:Exo-beta-N-acetylmuramidase NamZ domain-containing protein n=1 Tax=Ornithinibacillus salinisoli TaxID=1848459 RepID=A0ABW4W2I2_9BACI